MKKRGQLTLKASYSENNHWWRPIEGALSGVRLNGLRIKCPRCRKEGMVVTRWVKGLALKPVYVLHINKSKVEKVCKLNESQANRVRCIVTIKKCDIKKLMNGRKSFVLFSGGVDSLCVLSYLNKISDEVNCNLTAIFIDTTVGLPENIKYVKKVCRYLRIKLKIVKPKIDYFTLAEKWGIPSFRSRWCCRELKIKPIKEYLDKIKEPKVVFDGIRATESYVRKKYIPIWYHPGFKCISASPIFYWSDNRVSTYIHSNGLPKSPLHFIGSSTECWCGAYKRKSDFEKLYQLNQDMFHKLIKLEESNKNGYTFIYKNGKRIPLRSLIK